MAVEQLLVTYVSFVPRNNVIKNHTDTVLGTTQCC